MKASLLKADPIKVLPLLAASWHVYEEALLLYLSVFTYFFFPVATKAAPTTPAATTPSSQATKKDNWHSRDPGNPVAIRLELCQQCCSAWNSMN